MDHQTIDIPTPADDEKLGGFRRRQKTEQRGRALSRRKCIGRERASKQLVFPSRLARRVPIDAWSELGPRACADPGANCVSRPTRVLRLLQGEQSALPTRDAV